MILSTRDPRKKDKDLQDQRIALFARIVLARHEVLAKSALVDKIRLGFFGRSKFYDWIDIAGLIKQRDVINKAIKKIAHSGVLIQVPHKRYTYYKLSEGARRGMRKPHFLDEVREIRQN